MKTITFKNGKIINYDFFERTQPFFMGSSREGVKCTMSASEISLAELNSLLNDESATSEFKLTEEDGFEEIKTGYVLKKEVSVKSTMVKAETPEAPAIYADVITFELCQRTYTENILARLGLK